MSFKRALFKTSISMIALCSVFAWAQSFYDKGLYSDDFMDQNSGVIVKRVDESFTRIVASESLKEDKHPAICEKDPSKVNGKWEIVRAFEDINDQVSDYFNKFEREEDKDKFIEVKLELVNCMVYLEAEDFSKTYYIIDISDLGTISLARKLADKTFEVMELKKLKVVKKSQSNEVYDSEKESNESKPVYKKGLTINKDIDLVLERGLLQSFSKTVLKHDKVSGELSIVAGNIDYLSVSLTGPKGERKTMSCDAAKVTNGGKFETDCDNGDHIHGFLLNNGKDSYNVRIATGEFQNAVLSFMTQEGYDLAVEREEEARLKMQEAGMIRAADGHRDDYNSEDQVNREEKAEKEEQEFRETDEPTEDSYSEEEVVQVINKSGFNFGAAPSRSIASEK